MNMQGKYTCTGCKAINEIKFKKPGLLESTVLAIVCSECQSEIGLKVEKPKLAIAGTYKVTTYSFKASEFLRAKKAAERAAKPVNPFDNLKA